MERKLDQISKQLAMHKAQFSELQFMVRQQADTANRRCDATNRILQDNFNGLNRRLDRHELVFEAIDGRFDGPEGPMVLA